MKYKVTMVCKAIWRADVTIERDKPIDLEKVKDIAWAHFDSICKKDLEQENFTKVEALTKEDA